MAEPPASPTSYVNGTNSSASVDKVCYTDPDADTTLISTPEGRVFKVNSFWLKANSLYLRRFLTSPDYHGDPITVPASAKVLKIYLDLCHTRHPHPKAVWKLRDPLLKLCEEYQSPSIAERALFHSSECMDKDPWEVFCLASQRRNLGLAKAALRALAEDRHELEITDLKPEMAAGVTMPYLLGLYNAALATKGTKTTKGSLNGTLNGDSTHVAHDAHGDGVAGDGMTWRAIADKFTPVMG